MVATVVACNVVAGPGSRVPQPGSRCVGLAEYRLDELSRISGVSARNIRAYRERGLLEPPRRVGRSAYYNGFHLAQLETINQLHRRGFSSAHIAEFFAGMRAGRDLVDLLGLQRAVRRPVLALDPAGDEARTLLDLGLADLVDGLVVLTDPAIAKIVNRAADPLPAVRAILAIVEATRDATAALAADATAGLTGYLEARPEATDQTLAVRDYRELANAVIARRVGEELRQRTAPAVPDHDADTSVGERGVG